MKILLVLFLFSNILFAQVSKYFVGFVSDVPVSPLGIMGGTIASEKVGAYFSIRLDTDAPSPEEHMGNVHYNLAKYTYGDEERKSTTKDVSASAGVTFDLFDTNLFFYGGLTYTESTRYINFFDRLYILGDGGNYYVDDPGGKVIRFGINTGVLFLVSPAQNSTFYFSIGTNVNPTSLALGVGYSANWFN